MADSASQAEDSLEDDGDMRHTRTAAARRKRSPSETAEQMEVRLAGNWLQHKCCRASATWEQREVHLAADRLLKQRHRAEETVPQCGSRLKHLRSTQAQRLAAEREEQRAARLQQLSSNHAQHLAAETEEQQAAAQFTTLLYSVWHNIIRVRVIFPYYYFTYLHFIITICVQYLWYIMFCCLIAMYSPSRQQSVYTACTVFS